MKYIRCPHLMADWRGQGQNDCLYFGSNMRRAGTGDRSDIK